MTNLTTISMSVGKNIGLCVTCCLLGLGPESYYFNLWSSPHYKSISPEICMYDSTLTPNAVEVFKCLLDLEIPFRLCSNYTSSTNDGEQTGSKFDCGQSR